MSIAYYKPSQKIKIYITYLFLFALISGLLVSHVPPGYRFDLIRAGILGGFFGLFFIRKRKFDYISKVILFFSAYVIIMAFVTYTNFGYFPDKSIKLLYSSLFFIIGYNVVKTTDEMLFLCKIFVYGMGIVIIYIIISNIFGLGPQHVPGVHILDLEELGRNITKSLPFFIFPALLLVVQTKDIKQRNVIILIICLAILLILIGQKRGTLLAFFFGLITYLAFSPYKISNFKISIAVAVLAFILLPYYGPYIVQTFEERQERHSVILTQNIAEIESEGRYLEFERTLTDLEKRGFAELLFGVGFASEHGYYNVRRMLHTDYMMFLDGTGILGLFIYMYIFYLVFMKTFKYSQHFKKEKFVLNLRAVVFSLIVVSLITAISGFSHGIDLRAYFMLFTGAAIGVLSQNYKNTHSQLNRL